VDSGIAVSQQKIVAALHSIELGGVRYVIDTHSHWDPTDGNGWLRRTSATHGSGNFGAIRPPVSISRSETYTSARTGGWEFVPGGLVDEPCSAQMKISGIKTRKILR
jgi:glyoxylase-like metal-dependent hydrolase (beta-lactamase superfamily II)